MSPRSDAARIGVPVAIALPLLLGQALVLVRDTVGSQVVALALACTVVVGARIGGRVGGVGAAVTAALSFDFFHTVPYRSLKIANTDDILVTILLLAVGLLVGTSAGRLSELRDLAQSRYRAVSAVTRVLAVSHDGPVDDVELAVRAELIGLLRLEDCWFSPTPVSRPVLDRDTGYLRGAEVTEAGFTLPPSGVTVPVVANGESLGWLVCEPQPGAGIPTANRRVACALGEVLGLALSSRRAA